MNGEDKNELKRKWKFFLLFGLLIIVINTIIQVSLTNYINEKMEGPPCRIDFSVEEFPMTKSTFFDLPYLFINLRDKNLLINLFGLAPSG